MQSHTIEKSHTKLTIGSLRHIVYWGLRIQNTRLEIGRPGLDIHRISLNWRITLRSSELKLRHI